MGIRPFAFLIALVLFAAGPAQAQRQWFADGPVPSRYEISITPNAEAATFSGEARITIASEAQLASVTMNALDLTIARATIDGQPVAFDTDSDAQTLTLTPRRPLRAGRHTIRVVYSGTISDDAYGLFRVAYDDNGTQKRALATQFEPGDARRFAPMWDQPNRRAVFQLTVTAPSDQMVISNMPAERVQRFSGGLTRTRFAETPAMSSYLLFMAMGDFERLTADVDGVELGVVVRRGQGERARFALQAGAESLRYFTQYFDIPYPLPKLDMIGVPGAGGFGAMENWGAILYFDQYLLLDEYSSEGERQNVFSTVAHEIAHQWFGNLVTMVWWDDLWLNEGFASWMAAKAIEAVHPDWNPWMAQLTLGTATAMALDAREGTHPVVQMVNTIDEANLAFDTITYEKGLAVIRMLEAYVGEEAFRTGVRAYLRGHLYGNARTEDLWAAIQAASGQPILDIARSFTTQAGYPILRVSAPECGAQIAFEQRRFALDDASRTGERWTVPVMVRRLGQSAQHIVLPATERHEAALEPACAPYIVNTGQSGFFRVLYDPTNFARLIAAFRQLEPVDQLGLLLDYWSFGRSGDAPFTDYLNLVSALGPDADPLIVMDTAASIAALVQYVRGRPSEAAVRAWGRSVLRPYFNRAGWTEREGEPANETLMRAELIAQLGYLGDEAIIAEARQRVRSDNLSASVRGAALSVYAMHASTQDYETLVRAARAANDFVDQRRMWLQVASAADPALAQRTLHLTLGETIPRQIRTQVIAAVANEHPRMAWNFLVANRSAVEQLLDPLTRLDFPTAIASVNADPAVATELAAYARSFPAGAESNVAAAIAAIRLRARTIDERMPAVEAWVAARAAQQRGR